MSSEARKGGVHGVEGIKINGVARKANPVNFWWAMLGSNQRPLPCEGSALPLS